MPSRKPLARHARHKSPHPLKQILTIMLAMVLSVTAAGAAVVAFVVWDSYQRFSENSVELPSDNVAQIPPELAFNPYPGEVNFLITGTDECEEEFAHLFGGRCDGSDDGARNDVTLLVHIPEDHSNATIVSFPRDLMTSVPSCVNEDGVSIAGSDYRQINSTYDTGGLSCVVKTVEELSGFQIPFAAKISWGGVITVTDELGGVDVCIANGIHDSHTGLALEPGTHNLAGLEALQFLRTRHGLSDGSDLARISNQQLYMAALLKKITGEGLLEEPWKLLNTAEVVVNNVEHSSSLNEPTTLVSLAMLLKELPLENINFVQLPTYAAPSDPNRVVANEAAAAALWETIRNSGVIELEDNGQGAIVEDTPATETPIEENTQTPAPEPGASAKGLNASANACANGAG